LGAASSGSEMENGKWKIFNTPSAGLKHCNHD